VEAISLLGGQLAPPPLTAEIRAQREKELAAARADYDRSPNDGDAIIWLGRRMAYLGRYREAIAIFSEGIGKVPNDARLYRHRGHRYITVREFDDAIADLEKAAALTRGKPDEVEPDGLPNPRNIPVGSLQSNICYHLGLAHYLKGDFERALPVYRDCASAASNPDRLVSVSHWLFMTLRRLGRPQEAEKVLEPISSSLDVIENASYHKLLLMYRGEITLEDLMKESMAGLDRATILYGIGNWHLYNGDSARAEETFRAIVAAPDQWPAFGFIAAEAELARLPETSRPQGSGLAPDR
jgi:tetratricopeptide (TPR) repeat protein